MVGAGAVLKFPGGRDDPDSRPICFPKEPPPIPKLDTFSFDETVGLYQITTFLKRKGEEFVDFLDRNRPTARQAGIETVVIQIMSLLEGEKFHLVVEAIEDAVYRRVPVSLTREGLDKIERMERLVADATSGLKHFTTGRGVSPTLGQMAPYGGTGSDLSIWMPVVILGLVGIVGAITLALTQNSRTP